jgi:hypothetical protein
MALLIIVLIVVAAFFHMGRSVGRFEERHSHERAVKEATRNITSISDWKHKS